MIKLIKHIIVSIFLLACIVEMHGQSVKAEVDSTNIMIGDHLKYRLLINNADGVTNPRADFSNLDTLESFEIVKEQDWQKLTDQADEYYQKELTITSFDSGYFYFPSLGVAYEKNGKKYSQSSQQIQLNVFTPRVDSLHIRDIKGIVEEPIKLEDFYGLIMTVGLFLILGLLGYYLYKRYKNKPQEEIYVPPKPAHEIALTKLQALKEKELWQQGKLKEYQSELTYIVREYLEERFKIQALESTTKEIVTELKQKDISEDHKLELTDMFRMADMVKFAKAIPPVDIQSALLNKAVQFVENTKQEIIEEPQIPTE